MKNILIFIPKNGQNLTKMSLPELHFRFRITFAGSVAVGRVPGIKISCHGMQTPAGFSSGKAFRVKTPAILTAPHRRGHFLSFALTILICNSQ